MVSLYQSLLMPSEMSDAELYNSKKHSKAMGKTHVKGSDHTQNPLLPGSKGFSHKLVHGRLRFGIPTPKGSLWMPPV